MKKTLNKVREMKGVRPGRGSAGRANAALNGKGFRCGEAKRVGFRVGAPDGFVDVDRACKKWLVEHGVPMGGMREVMMAEMRRREADG